VATTSLQSAIVFKGGFVSKAQVINFDLGIGDPVTPGPRKLKIKSLLSEEELSWSVYPVETIIAEKVHALIANGDFNSRSKDVFDLIIFLDEANPKNLNSAIQNTFKFRGTDVPKSIAEVLSSLRTDRLKKAGNLRPPRLPVRLVSERLFSQLFLNFVS